MSSAEINTQIVNIKTQFQKELADITIQETLDALFLKYFSKKSGILVTLIKLIPTLSDTDKKTWVPQINALKTELEKAIKTKELELKQASIQNPLIDLTMPSAPKRSGYIHPTNQVIQELNSFFRYYGFSVAEGPEIETAEFNFRKLNLPEGHPATDLQDTLFIKEPDLLLRTHTSSVEARILTNYKPPIRVVVPGKVYRNETTSKASGAFFHHYQGVVVEKGITIQHLKATLELVHKHLFGNDVILRFRYKYYPEVSPGMGIDMQCKFCKGAGCDVCKTRGWIESLGSGMIHYNTLKMCGIDPEVYTGFAFGMGLDRLVMQKFKIGDIRKMYGKGMVYK